jgi:hypothetical protein
MPLQPQMGRVTVMGQRNVVITPIHQNGIGVLRFERSTRTQTREQPTL